MWRQVVRLLSIAVGFWAMVGCGGGGGTTSVEMSRTIDVLALLGTPAGAIPVTGFKLGTDLEAPQLTTATWTAETRRLGGAGRESPPCNDGARHRLAPVGGTTDQDLFVQVEVIGDTGGSDISDDRDCGCDTQVASLVVNHLRIEPNPPFVDVSRLEIGRELLCPNRLDDLVVGDGQFDGEVDVDLTATLRVADGGLLLDVTYFARSVR